MNSIAIKLLQVFIDADLPNRGNLLFDQSGIIIQANVNRLEIAAEAGSSVGSAFDKHDIFFPLEDIIEKLKVKSATSLELSNQDESSDQCYQIEVYKVEIKDKNQYLLLMTDISKQKNRDRQLKSLSRNLDNELKLRTREIVMTQEFLGTKEGGFLVNFLRGLRHDLSSPLAQLKSLFDYFNKTDDPQKKQRIQEHMNNSMTKFDQTVKSLNAFINLYFMPNRNIEEMELNSIFKDNIQQLKEQYSAKKIDISSNFEAVNIITYNKILLQSIFQNMLSNAFKFSSKDRDLKIETWSEKTQDGIKLFFRDNGTGMDLKQFGHHLFTPFKRINHQHPGAGMGLSLIKNSLERFGDKIEIESKLDQGTTVVVYLKNQTWKDSN